LDGLFNTADDTPGYFIPNIKPDFGFTVPFNAWMTLFGQFLDHGQYVANVKAILTVSDVAQGVIKSTVFGLLVILIGCYQGFNASGGGRGVGLGTTRAVVTASASILIIDYFLSDLLLSIMGGALHRKWPTLGGIVRGAGTFGPVPACGLRIRSRCSDA